jgi:hypothetical protein
MGRRSRRRASSGTPTPTRDHQARVKVSDDVWTDFRELHAHLAELVKLLERRLDARAARPR